LDCRPQQEPIPRVTAYTIVSVLAALSPPALRLTLSLFVQGADQVTGAASSVGPGRPARKMKSLGHSFILSKVQLNWQRED
jgi:hypothetical protein